MTHRTTCSKIDGKIGNMNLASLRRQAGNTLTGVIIGLVVGLVIAVIVALLITKGSSPFTDKTGKGGKMSEPTAGQASDPNKPLYGNKEAAIAANKEVAAKGKAAQDDPLGAAVAAIEAGKPPAPPAAPVAPAAPAGAPAADKPPAAEPGAANVAPTVAGEEKITYHLQAGAFREMEDAENTRAKLALLGFEASISERVNDSGILYRVRVGPFPQPEAMNKARAKLIDNGIDVAIVKNQK
jgi:cell division protein FtsN